MARKSKKRQKSTKAEGAPAAPQVPAKRRSLVTLGAWGLGAVGVIGGGAALAYDFQRKLVEHDLTQIGQGIPMVVQIHDPSCSLCRALQREARSAMTGFASDDLQYLVANIRTPEGAAFAASMGLSHVTLVLLDGRGAPRGTVEGVTPAAQITEQIQARLSVPQAGS